MKKYDAFISYSHAADGRLAPALQKALHRIARPILKFRALNVFRDETSLSATPNLWSTIEEALGQSKYLILLASPTSAKSSWVQKEVDFWLANHSIASILIGVTEGSISWSASGKDFNWEETNCLPMNLQGQFKEQPLFVDFREVKSKEDLSIDNPNFKKKAATIAASVHGKPVNDLIGEDVRIRRNTIRTLILIVTALIGLSIGLLRYAKLSNSNEKKFKEEAKNVRLKNDTLVLQYKISDSLRLKAEGALITAYENQIGILTRDRNKILNRIQLAIQAERPQDTVSYHNEASALYKEMFNIGLSINSLKKNQPNKIE